MATQLHKLDYHEALELSWKSKFTIILTFFFVEIQKENENNKPKQKSGHDHIRIN